MSRGVVRCVWHKHHLTIQPSNEGRAWFILIALMLCMVGVARGDYPIVSQRYAADPAGVEFNGRIYLYCSNDDDNGTNGYIMHSITCFSSDDLKNWTDHGVVLDVPSGASWANLSWAPSAVSNNNKVYLYFAKNMIFPLVYLLILLYNNNRY